MRIQRLPRHHPDIDMLLGELRIENRNLRPQPSDHNKAVKALLPDDAFFLGSKEDGMPVCVGVLRERRGCSETLHVYTRPDHRREGCGRELFQLLRFQIRMMGIDIGFVAVPSAQDAGAQFFRAMHFEDCAPLRAFGYLPDENMYFLKRSMTIAYGDEEHGPRLDDLENE